jgi:hypothetical protein
MYGNIGADVTQGPASVEGPGIRYFTSLPRDISLAEDGVTVHARTSLSTLLCHHARMHVRTHARTHILSPIQADLFTRAEIRHISPFLLVRSGTLRSLRSGTFLPSCSGDPAHFSVLAREIRHICSLLTRAETRHTFSPFLRGICLPHSILCVLLPRQVRPPPELSGLRSKEVPPTVVAATPLACGQLLPLSTVYRAAEFMVKLNVSALSSDGTVFCCAPWILPSTLHSALPLMTATS